MFIFFSFLFSLLAIYLGFKLHDKFDPARYFLIIWGVQVVLIYSVFHNYFSFSGWGLVYISCCCLIFSMGSLSGKLLGVILPEKDECHVVNSDRALLLLKISLVLAFLNVIIGIYENGFSLSELTSFNKLIELNTVASDNRYMHLTSSSLMNQLTLIFVYLSPLLGGYVLPILKNNRRIWSFMAVVPALLISLTQSIKLGFISSVLLWVVGLIVSSYANNKDFFRMRLTTFLKISFYGISFMTILFFSMAFRVGKFDSDSLKMIGERFFTYAFGHLPAFDSWFTKNIGEINPTNGVKTFYGITNYLGIAERKQGVFSEIIFLGKNNNPQSDYIMSTNVYTMFRFIVEDFGYIGSILMIFTTGMLSGFSWLMMLKKRATIFFQTILIAVLFFIFLSFATSAWVYTSYIATMVLMYLFLFSIFKKDHKIQLSSLMKNASN